MDAASSTVAEDSGPPNVQSSLPEGKLLVNGPLGSGANGQRTSYMIEGHRAITLAPTEVAVSADAEYAFYLERSDEDKVSPTAVVVVRLDGTEVFREALSLPVWAVGWAPSGSRFAYQSEWSVYVRDFDSGEHAKFDVAGDTHVQSWLPGGSELLVVTEAPQGRTDRKLYRVDSRTGATFEIVLPAGAIVGPGAEFATFSPDGRYVGYPSMGSDARGCFYQCNLNVIELATGRTCVLAQDAPSHQYPQRVGWSPDGSLATYYAMYASGQWSEQHAVDAETCVDTAIEPTPRAPTATAVRIPGVSIGADAHVLESPSGRYLLVYRFDFATSLESDETPPPEKTFLLTPSPGDATMYVVDKMTGRVTLLVDERREFQASAWLP